MDEVRQLLQHVIEAYHRRDLVGARGLLARLQIMAPNDPRVWHWSALCAEDDAERRDALVRVISLDPAGRLGMQARPRLAALLEVGRGQPATLPPTAAEAQGGVAGPPLSGAVTSLTHRGVASGSHDAALRSGVVIGGRFKILELIGRGGFGSIYRARDQKTGALCAVKQLIQRDSIVESSQEAVIASLEREVRLLASLASGNIQNIPRILDYIPEHLCLVMDYIKGDALAVYQHRKQEGRLSEREALILAREICATLVIIHGYTDEHGITTPIIHGDITPANILVGGHRRLGTGERRLWLIDFGLAQTVLRRVGAAIEPERGAGTPGFAAPEQLRGRVGPRSDVYALGMTLRAMLHSATPASVAVKTGRLGRRSSRVKSVSPSVIALIERATHDDLSERPSAKALHEHLELLLATTTARTQVQGLSATLVLTLLCALLTIALLSRATLAPMSPAYQGERTGVRSLEASVVTLPNVGSTAPAEPPVEGAGTSLGIPSSVMRWQGKIAVNDPPITRVIDEARGSDEWDLVSYTTTTVTVWARGADNDIALTLSDAQDVPLDSDIDSGGNFALIHYHLLAGQSYKVRVRSLDEESEYNLAVVSHRMNEMSSHALVETTPPVSVEEWRIPGDRGGQLAIQAQPHDSAIADIIISVLSPQGEMLISAQTSEYWSPPMLDLEKLPETGEYTVRAVTLVDNPVRYDIVIMASTQLEADEYKQDELAQPGEVDQWMFTPPVDGYYTIAATPKNSDLDIVLGVIDESSTVDNFGSGEKEEVRKYLLADEPVRINVSGNGESDGPYSLFAHHTQ
ncbi:MAG: protein kinase [Oscillochloris sp.]|nr:protein kinase [Oscillochloris sp.]